jgi:hypothetical protein
MSDTKDASHTSKGKIASSRWGYSSIPSRREILLLAPLLSFSLQAVLLWCVSS